MTDHLIDQVRRKDQRIKELETENTELKQIIKDSFFRLRELNTKLMKEVEHG